MKACADSCTVQCQMKLRNEGLDFYFRYFSGETESEGFY